jgi:ParB-like chromosome segregation protein Spo0J
MELNELGAQVPVQETRSQRQNGSARRHTLDQVATARVAISSLVIAGSPRLTGENAEHIHALVDAQTELPPIIVHRPNMRVIDGIHRLRAAERRGQTKIDVRFFDGDEADAFVTAVRLNVAHGLPLSLADRKAAANRIITSHPHWSDRLIASVAGLAPATVAEIRRTLDTKAHSANSRIGRDGRSRPINRAERREIASRLLVDDPNQSLRQVAKVAGISPETVRDVRDQLRLRNEDLVSPECVEPRRSDHPAGNKRQRNATGHHDQVMRQLKLDPRLRGTETGRLLLRSLDMCRITQDNLDELCNHVPAYCKGTVAALAMECAETWRKFAEKLSDQDKRNTA